MEDKRDMWRPSSEDELWKVWAVLAVIAGCLFMVRLLSLRVACVFITWPIFYVGVFIAYRAVQKAYWSWRIKRFGK